MISLEEAKHLVAKFYLDELTDEESTTLNDFAKRYTYPHLFEDMRNDPKYKKAMPTIELYRGVLRDNFMGTRDN